LEGGDADEQRAVRTQHAPRRRHDRAIVLEVLEHVEHQHQVEARRAERQSVHVRARDPRDAAARGVAERLHGAVDADGTAVAREVREHPARAAADVEDAEPRACHAIAHQRGDQEPLADEPPVVVLVGRHLVDRRVVHRVAAGQARRRPRASPSAGSGAPAATVRAS
jgi:hypothetical protein